MAGRWRTVTVVAAALITLGLGTHPAAADEACTQDNCLNRVQIAPDTTLPYYASYPLTGSPTPTGAVIVIHGTGRNAEHYFSMTTEAAQQYGPRAKIIAPWFQTDEDDPQDSDAYWTNGDETSWKDGGNAVQPDLSSFAVIDKVLSILADKSAFPNLTKVTLLGHSAGAQFIQRYAAGGRGPDSVKGLDIHYVVANPSSYLYLNSKRPESTDDCSDYNDYKYGLDNRNAYMSELTEQQIIAQYTARRVTYLLGEKDTVQNGDMDDSCAANAQGPNRFERGKAHYTAIHQEYPNAPQDLSTVPGVGHDNEAMINSTQGKAAIFRGW